MLRRPNLVPRRRRDEAGFTMPFVVIVVFVGFLFSSMIAASTLGSVQQTTRGRSGVQAFAAAEAGRDTMAAGISQKVPACASATGTITGARWSAEMFYVPGTTLPAGTTYAADGSPQPAAAWTPVDCAGIAAANPGDYMVVVAATGVADDGTTRVIDAVFPLRIDPPDQSIVGTIRGPFTIGTSGIGIPAWSGGPLIVTGPPDQTNLTCGNGQAQPTIIDADVYVLSGDAEFRGDGCRITGDLYVKRTIIVAGRPSMGGLLGGRNRHLWVEGDVRVGQDINQVWGGLTVGGSITAGRDINLNGHDGMYGSEDYWGQVRVGTALNGSQVALWAGRDINLTADDEDFTCPGIVMGVRGAGVGVDRGEINGAAKAVRSVITTQAIDTWTPYCSLRGSKWGYENTGGNWSIAGHVSAGATVHLKDTPVGGITAGGAVTARAGSRVSGSVTAGGNVTLDNSPVSGAVRTAAAVAATNSTITGKVTSLTQGVMLTNSGAGEIVAKGNVTTVGTGAITGPIAAEGNVVLTTQVAGDVAANGWISATSAQIAGNVTSSYVPPAGSDYAVTLTDSSVGGTLRTSSGGVSATRGALNGNAVVGGRVALTGSITTKGVDASGRIDASGGGTLGGAVRSTASTAGVPAVTIAQMIVTGKVHANGLVRLLGASTVNGDVESVGGVEQTGGRIAGRVLTDGAYVGNPSAGLKVDKAVIAGGPVTIQNDATDNATVIGDGSSDPTIWSGGKVTLRGTKEAMTAVRGRVSGHVRSNSSAPAIEVQRTWTVTGQLQATGAKVTPETCSGEAVCAEGEKLKDAAIPAVPAEYGCRLKGTALWYTSTYPNKSACESAPWWDGKCVANCEWVVRYPFKPEVPAVYWPAAAAGAGAAAGSGRPSASSVALTLPTKEALTVAIPTSIPGITIPPDAPVAPTPNEIAVSADGSVLLDEGHWLDLSYDEVKTAAVESGYTTTLTFSGSDCKNTGWFGWGDSKAEGQIATALAVSNKKYLIDTTGCTDPLTTFMSSSPINSDAVFLVKNFKEGANFGSTNGTPLNPRRIYVIQPDSQPDRHPTCNNSGAAGNTQASEQSGRARLEYSFGSASDKVHTMIYAPCGLGSSTGATNTRALYGQVLVGASSTAQYTTFYCRPMALGASPLFNLTCDNPQTASDVDGTAGIKKYFLGAPIVQTEP